MDTLNAILLISILLKKNIENIYLIFASTDENKEILEKYTKLWNEIQNQIKTIIGGKPNEYKKDFVKIRFESDDNLPLGEMLSIPVMVITESVFQEGSKYYLQVLLQKRVYKPIDRL